MRRFKPASQPSPRVKRAAVPLLALAVLVLPLTSTLAQPGQGDVVLATSIDGTVTRGTAIQVQDAIDEAEERNAPLVIRLDTPGGLVSATLEINKAIARAEVPVMTYVGPRGAFAESAGTFILLMGHPNGMAPSTQIGSAQPIVQGAGGGVQNASSKTTNFLVGQIQSIADRTDRNQTLAKRFITQNLNMNETHAKETGMADVIAPTLEAFVASVHGEEAIAGERRVTLDTEDARIVHLEKGSLAQLVDLISNPQIAFILFLVGLYGVIFGLAAPGTFVPETIGALALVLGLVGLGLFDTSTSGLVLILLGGVFFVAEVFTPTHGILTTAGVVAMILGAIFLLDEPLLSRDFLQTFRRVGIASAVISGGVVLGAVWVALRTRDQPIETQLVGDTGHVTKRLDPKGKVRLRGELWNARTEVGPLDEGTEIVVTERDGLTVTVEPTASDTGSRTDEAPPADDQ